MSKRELLKKQTISRQLTVKIIAGLTSGLSCRIVISCAAIYSLLMEMTWFPLEKSAASGAVEMK